ncbi:type Z 30S ribosomal protein S14 [Candidatus Dojkabacteria bacterium]|uniref:Small ribosomal subunit protein uS14 n=1 Tax=Candidatus Dojkabacteria bacterium TaxID=2099670 RepID=A0A955L8U1_9BACT|nr:type Z 30S ribosomal protein S14 [Candidatus Dojkabacteria bacterium]
MSTTAQEAKERKLKRELNRGTVKYRTRVFNRCHISGRARGYMRRFGISRIAFRELALKGLLPGVKKASW